MLYMNFVPRTVKGTQLGPTVNSVPLAMRTGVVPVYVVTHKTVTVTHEASKDPVVRMERVSAR